MPVSFPSVHTLLSADGPKSVLTPCLPHGQPVCRVRVGELSLRGGPVTARLRTQGQWHLHRRREGGTDGSLGRPRAPDGLVCSIPSENADLNLLLLFSRVCFSSCGLHPPLVLYVVPPLPLSITASSGQRPPQLSFLMHLILPGVYVRTGACV